MDESNHTENNMRTKKFEYCPFCNSAQIDLTYSETIHGWLAIVECQTCLARGSDLGWKQTRTEARRLAIENWNNVHRTGGWFYEGVELWFDTIWSILHNVSAKCSAVWAAIPSAEKTGSAYRKMKRAIVNGWYNMMGV